jgi:hypothetical protein
MIEGLRRVKAHLGFFTDADVTHDHGCAFVVTDRGWAVWSEHNGETVLQLHSGQVYRDFGPDGDGRLRAVTPA